MDKKNANIANNIEKYDEEKHGLIDLQSWYIFRAAIILLAITIIFAIVWIGIAAFEHFDFRNIGLLVATIFFSLLLIGLLVAVSLVFAKGVKYNKLIKNKEKLLVVDAVVTKVSRRKVYHETTPERQFISPISTHEATSFAHAHQPMKAKRSVKTIYEFVSLTGTTIKGIAVTPIQVAKVGEKVQVFFMGKLSYPFFKLAFEPKSSKTIAEVNRADFDTSQLAKIMNRHFDREKLAKLNIDEVKAKAKKGNSKAQSDLGAIYLFGDLTDFDYDKVIYWWTLACEQNHSNTWSAFYYFQHYSYYSSAVKAYSKLNRRRKQIQRANIK